MSDKVTALSDTLSDTAKKLVSTSPSYTETLRDAVLHHQFINLTN